MKYNIIHLAIIFSFILIGCSNSKPTLSFKDIKTRKVTINQYAKESLFQDKEFNNIFGESKSLYATEENYNFLLKRQKSISNKLNLICQNQNAHIEILSPQNPTLTKFASDVHDIKKKKYTNIISTKLISNEYQKKFINKKNNNSIYIKGTDFPENKNLVHYTCIKNKKHLFDYYITPIYYDLVKTLFNYKNTTGKVTNEKERAVWIGVDQIVFVY